MRPRYTSFRDAGLDEALERGVRLLGEAAASVDFALWTKDFDQLAFELLEGRVGVDAMYDVATTCRAVERTLRAQLVEQLVGHGFETVASQWREDPEADEHLLGGVSALHPWSALGAESETRMALATVRLAIGAAIEVAFASVGVRDHWTMARPGKAVPLGKARLGGEAWAKSTDGKKQMRVARLYNDAALVAVWTSAHAVFVEDCQAGVLEAPPPSIFSVLNAYTEYNFSDLFARRVQPKNKDIKAAVPMLNMLIKAMSTSARGWESTFEQDVAKSTCLRNIVGRALIVSCTGLHQCVNPALRAPWRPRHTVAKRVASDCLGGKLPALLACATSAGREAVRRLLMTTVACAPAMTRALGLAANPIRIMQSPPLCAPAAGAEGCAECFAAAMRELCDMGRSGDGVEEFEHDAVAMALVRAFDQPAPSPRQKYDATWLGKGSSPRAPLVPFVQTAGALFAQAFRANFLPLWLHAFNHGERISRLEAVFYRAIHGRNAVTELVAELDEPTALRVQRLAFRNVSSALLGAADAAAELGLTVEQLQAPLAGDDEECGRVLATALSWARAAWLSEKVVIYELGHRTTGMQVFAILRRLCASAALGYASGLSFEELGRRKDEFLQGLPEQSTHLQACLSCGRVANPIVNEAKPGQHFDDVGASVAMNCTACNAAEDDYGQQHLRCAKRASAALRTAVLFEAHSVQTGIEERWADPEAVGAAVASAGRQRSTASGVGARAKRDAKAALDQRCGPKGCGDDPLLTVPLVGRCIALGGVKYALCSFCAAAVRVEPKHRAGGEICCLRCDGRVVTGFPPPKSAEEAAEEAVEAKAKAALGPPTERVCRFCGKVERTAGTHRTYKAPHDVAGTNGALPPPLRTVHFCAAHQRGWLQPALRTLPTRSILAHLSFNARPILGAGAAANLTNADLGLADDVRAVEGKRGKKRKT